MLYLNCRGDDRAERQRHNRGSEVDPVIGQRAAQGTRHQRRPHQQVRCPSPAQAAAQLNAQANAISAGESSIALPPWSAASANHIQQRQFRRRPCS